MDWLQRLLERLFCWLPRVLLISPDESGVRITLGSRVKALKPGWYVYLPLIQQCIYVTVTPQVVDLRPQSVLTKSGRDMCISGGIMYRIRDAANALLKVQDFDKSLQTVALGIISRYVNDNCDDCININEIEDAIAKGIKEHARGWGIEVMKIYITDLGSTKNLRILADTPVTSTVAGSIESQESE